jgi:autotransporter-associated beta strand protein
MAINGPVSGPGGLTKIGPGTLNLLGANSYAATTSVGAGRLILNQTFATNTSVAISAGAVLELAQAPAVTLKTSSIVATGKLDVKDNKLVITGQPVGTFNGTSYNGVTAMIVSAYNFTSWSGNGLTTTMPDALSGLTTLGINQADQTGFDFWGGVSVAPSNALVMYTYAGDGNLDGLIDGGDYGLIDNNVQIPGASGYGNGDFNYDGVIDGGDYGIIDNNIQAQGAPFPVSGSIGLSGVTAVPEPSACGLAILAAAATFLPRRRRGRGHRLAPR